MDTVSGRHARRCNKTCRSSRRPLCRWILTLLMDSPNSRAIFS